MKNPLGSIMDNDEVVTRLISEVTTYSAMEGINLTGLTDSIDAESVEDEVLGVTVRLATPVLLELLTTFAKHKPVPNGFMELIMNGSNDDFKALLCTFLGNIDEDDANVIVRNLKVVRGNVDNYSVVLDSLINKLEG